MKSETSLIKPIPIFSLYKDMDSRKRRIPKMVGEEDSDHQYDQLQLDIPGELVERIELFSLFGIHFQMRGR
jgi:hypothetical protein